MNSIKGLILKDILTLKNYKKSIITSALLFIVIFTMTGKLTMLSIMLIILFGLGSLATFNYDETSKTDKYILTLPTDKKEVIKARYLFVFTINIIGTLVSLILTLLLAYIIPKFNPGLIQGELTTEMILVTVLSGLCAAMLIESIQIPSIIKWGVERGKIQMFVIVALIVIIGIALYYMLYKLGINIYLPDNISNIAMLGTAIFIFILYYVSYLISYRIYSKKEF